MRMTQRAVVVGGLGAVAATVPAIALGHGPAVPAPTLAGALTTVVPEPLPWIGSIAAVAGYLWLAGRVDRAHPRTTVPRWRLAAWVAGVLTILVALVSGVDVYAEELLTVHMIQHLLLAMVAPPLLALGAPVTLVLRASSPDLRRRWWLPILHSRLLRGLASPVVAWTLFTLVMWFSHFSPLYEAALEDPAIHLGEHLGFLATGVLFWWPVVAADPLPRRIGYLGRFAYLVLQMPVNAAVGLAIYFAPGVIYAHYAASERSWGPSPLVDQQVGGLIMWAAGDVLLLGAITAVVVAWMQADARRTRRAEARAR